MTKEYCTTGLLTLACSSGSRRERITRYYLAKNESIAAQKLKDYCLKIAGDLFVNLEVGVVTEFES